MVEDGSYIERFKKYIAVDTRSDDKSETSPSTKGQLELGAILVDELKAFGLKAEQDSNGYVYGEIPATASGKKTLGLIAHLDTSPDLDGKCVNPRVFTYTGGDIVLNEQDRKSVV